MENKENGFVVPSEEKETTGDCSVEMELGKTGGLSIKVKIYGKSTEAEIENAKKQAKSVLDSLMGDYKDRIK